MYLMVHTEFPGLECQQTDGLRLLTVYPISTAYGDNHVLVKLELTNVIEGKAAK